MAKTPTPKTEDAALTVNEALLLVGQKVYIEGNYAGGDYRYEGKVTAVHLAGKPALELLGKDEGPGRIRNETKGDYPIFVPVRSVLHVREIAR